MMYILPFYFICGVVEVLVGCMRGMNYAVLPTIASFLCVCAYRIVWVFTAFRVYRDMGTLWLSYPISWVFNLLVDTVMIFFVFRAVFRKKQELGECGESLQSDE